MSIHFSQLLFYCVIIGLCTNSFTAFSKRRQEILRFGYGKLRFDCNRAAQ